MLFIQFYIFCIIVFSFISFLFYKDQQMTRRTSKTNPEESLSFYGFLVMSNVTPGRAARVINTIPMVFYKPDENANQMAHGSVK
jgi:hypothetical protein